MSISPFLVVTFVNRSVTFVHALILAHGFHPVNGYSNLSMNFSCRIFVCDQNIDNLPSDRPTNTFYFNSVPEATPILRFFFFSSASGTETVRSSNASSQSSPWSLINDRKCPRLHLSRISSCISSSFRYPARHTAFCHTIGSHGDQECIGFIVHIPAPSLHWNH